MCNVYSPPDFSESVLILIYDLDYDNMTISDGRGTSWDSRRDSIDALEYGMFDGISITYYPDYKYLLFYFGNDSTVIRIVPEADVSYFFAEVDQEGAITNNNTGDNTAVLPDAGMSVKLEGKRLKLSPLETTKTVSPPVQPTNTPAQPTNEVQELKDEIQRLQKLITQISDDSYQKAYTLVQDMDINAKTSELFGKKMEYERLSRSLEDMQRQLDELQAKRAALEQQAEDLRADLAKAEEVNAVKGDEIGKLSGELEKVLASLGVDIQTLAMYKGSSEIDDMLKEAEGFAARAREVLKKNVELRQKLCRERHDNIAGN